MDEYNIIEIKCGDEYRVCIDDAKNICKKDRFFYPVFRKSAELVKEIVSHFSDRVNDDGYILESDYHNNIIMYCAERGSGKSSAMCTFANALALSRESGDVSESLGKLFDKNLNDYNFFVLDPIDPTLISEFDMFMRIVLSKMFTKLRKKWDKSSKRSEHFVSDNIQDDRISRSKIIKQFMKCYRFIDVIYQRGGKFDCDDDLEELADLGDSGRFKKAFWELVKSFLKEMTGKTPGQNDVMVIQIDDTDLNSKMAFNIVEDIRKYCIIPNVIILMAVDIKQMHNVLEQHFLLDFKPMIDLLKDSIDYHEMAMRYVDKVLPVSHQIHLPTVDNFIRNNLTTLNIKYFSEDSKERVDILDFKKTTGSQTASEKKMDYQEALLRFVYNKTGIALVKPSSYLHNILPRTMRGLGHFLAYMNTLPDLDKELGITEIYELTVDGVRKEIEGVIGRTYSDAVTELHKRIDNLEAFKQYFLKNWCMIRLSKTCWKYIETLENTADETKVLTADKMLNEMYPNFGITNDDFVPPMSENSYAYIQERISKISAQALQTKNPAETYMFTYAMNMYFMLFFNRMVLNCVYVGSFEHLLKAIQLEAWVPFNGKLDDHKEDMMYGRFTVNYKVLQKFYSNKDLEDNFIDKVFVIKQNKNYKFDFNHANSSVMAGPSQGKDSETQMIFDFGYALLRYACFQDPYKEENVFERKNAVMTILCSYDLQHYIKKNGAAPSFSSEPNKDSLYNIFKCLNNIDYLPIQWNVLSGSFLDIDRIRFANKDIVLILVDEWFKELKVEFDKVGIGEKGNDRYGNRADFAVDKAVEINILNRIQSCVIDVRPIFVNIITIYNAISPKGRKRPSKPDNIEVSAAQEEKKVADKNKPAYLISSWKMLFELIENYSPTRYLENSFNESGNFSSGIDEKYLQIRDCFIDLAKLINDPSVESELKNKIRAAFRYRA